MDSIKRRLCAALSIIACLSAAGCAGTDYDEYQDTIVLKHGPGGMVHPIYARYQDFRSSGKRVIIDGQMISADATFAFGVPGACYTRRAVFSPHAASYMGVAPAPEATKTLSHFLPWKLGEWFRKSDAYHDWIGYPRVGYAELVEIWPEGACDAATEAKLTELERDPAGQRMSARIRALPDAPFGGPSGDRL